MTLKSQLPLLDINTLSTLVEVFESGSFASAARNVGKSPSTVTKQVQALEALLGQTLFDRSSRQLEVTRAGQQLLIYARKLLQLSREAVALLSEPALCGSVRLGISLDIEEFLPDILSMMAKAFPKILIDVVSGSAPVLIRQYEAGQLDLVLLVDADGSQTGMFLTSHRLVWAGKPAGNAFARVPLPLIVFDRENLWSEPLLENVFIAARRGRFVFTNLSSTGVVAAVEEDLAIVAIPECMSGGLEILELDYLPELPELQVRLLNDENPSSLISELSNALIACFTSSGRSFFTAQKSGVKSSAC